MGDVLSCFCWEPLENEELSEPPPKDICGREWNVLAKQLKGKRNAAIQASNDKQREATKQDRIGESYDAGEAKAKVHQILLLHQAMRSARNAHRNHCRLQQMWQDVDGDVLESIEIYGGRLSTE